MIYLLNPIERYMVVALINNKTILPDVTYDNGPSVGGP